MSLGIKCSSYSTPVDSLFLHRGHCKIIYGAMHQKAGIVAFDERSEKHTLVDFMSVVRRDSSDGPLPGPAFVDSRVNCQPERLCLVKHLMPHFNPASPPTLYRCHISHDRTTALPLYDPDDHQPLPSFHPPSVCGGTAAGPRHQITKLYSTIIYAYCIPLLRGLPPWHPDTLIVKSYQI